MVAPPGMTQGPKQGPKQGISAPGPTDSTHTSITNKNIRDKAKEVAESELQLSEELQSFMNRMTRTGCVAFDIISVTLGGGGAKISYSLTPLYSELKKYISEDNPA